MRCLPWRQQLLMTTLHGASLHEAGRHRIQPCIWVYCLAPEGMQANSRNSQAHPVRPRPAWQCTAILRPSTSVTCAITCTQALMLQHALSDFDCAILVLTAL